MSATTSSTGRRLWPVLALDAVRSQILLSANEQERANLSGAKIGGEF